MEYRVKVVSIREAKCNFCHEWIVLPKDTPRSLYSCQHCLSLYQQPTIIHDEQGNPHLMTIASPNISFLSNQQNQELRLTDAISSQIELLSREVPEMELVKSGVSTKYNDSMMENRNSLSSFILAHKGSQDKLFDEYTDKLSRKRSRIFEGEQSISDDKISIWDDTYLASEKNKRKMGYQFFYDSNQIERFRENRESGRSFGTQLQIPLNFNLDELYLHLKRNRKSSSGASSNRSNRSQDPSQCTLRLKDDALKLKIDSYLETRYQSSSFQRIMASNIKEAYEQTNIQAKMIELVSFNVASIDLLCYLSLFEGECLNTLKLVNLGLKDDHVKEIVEWIGVMKVERLVLTCNRLTDNCLPLFTGRALPYLKEIYLGRNRINKYRMRENIIELRSKFILYL